MEPREAPSRPHPHTCGRVPVLSLMEFAHRAVTNRPLCLAPADLEVDFLKHHLEVERCEVCLRWFENAKKTYRRKFKESQPTNQSAPKWPFMSEARPPDQMDQIAAAHGVESFTQRWQPQPGATGLEALPRVLEWVQEGQPDSDRWRVTLKFSPGEGNPPERLRELDGLRIALERYPLDGSDPQWLETRLGFEGHSELVSFPETWVVKNAKSKAPICFVIMGQTQRPEFT